MSLGFFEKQYDVVVIGAGPAGSTAARFAASSGAETLLLERDREPGVPVRCAEAVSESGLHKFVEPEDKWIAAKIDNAHLVTPDGNLLTLANKAKGYILERRIFDAALCEIACNNGAKFLTKADAIGLERKKDKTTDVFVRHLGEIYKVNTKIVIGADGVESRVGRWGGLVTRITPDEIASCVQYTINKVDIDDRSIYFYFGQNIAPGGYLWVFPKSRTKANVGLGIPGRFATKKKVKEYLDDFVIRHFPGSSIEYIVYGGVPTTNTLRHISSEGLMLVGDAARQVNPITGGGIVQGMVAAKIAGNIAGASIKSGDWSAGALKAYDKEWDKTLGKTQRFMCSMKDKVVTMKDERINKIATLCRNIPRENFTLTELFKQTIKGDPKLIAQMASAFVVSKLNI